ncbi:MAG: DPP IV N-terminal domain-containing protein, partial [Planctomycetes bacterium]|nr:DPP IV N-terminal domain-containing protein [Planctomycetota bacterium]
MSLTRIGLRPVLTLCLFVFVSVAPVCAQAQPERARANWELADKYTSSFLRQFTYSTSVRPSWIGKTDRLWYSYKTSAGTTYWLVDAKARTKTPLFDHSRMAALVSEATGEAQTAKALSLSGLKVSDDEKTLDFTAGGHRLRYHVDKDTIESRGKARSTGRSGSSQGRSRGGRQTRTRSTRGRTTTRSRGGRGRSSSARGRSTSPDGKLKVFARDNNLFVVEGKPSSAIARSGKKPDDDAKTPAKSTLKNVAAKTATNGKGTNGDTGEKVLTRKTFGSEDMSDSEIASFLRRVSAGEKLDAEAVVGSRGPRLVFDDDAAIALSSDGETEYGFGGSSGSRSRTSVTWKSDSSAFYTTRRDSRGLQELSLVDSIAQPRPKVRNYNYAMPGEDRVRKSELHVFHRDTNKLIRVEPRWKDESYSTTTWWDNGQLRMYRTSRTRRDMEYGVVDPKTGKVTTLLMESVAKGNLNTQRMRWLEDKKSFIWWSERSGWGHYYLYDSDGKLKNAITKGPFRVSSIVSLDEKKGVMWVRSNGRESGENVYYEHLYRVNLDGTGLTLLDPGDANHRSTLSASKRFLVDNASRVDRAPISSLRDAQGQEIMKLGECDLSRLYEAGWRMPETFTVKAADGVTDLYGNMWKPFDFDAKKRYPIILSVYPG